MIKCRIFAPWFGPLPPHKALFLESCAKSPDIQWVIHTDQVIEDALPENIVVFYVDSIVSRLEAVFPNHVINKSIWTRKLTDLKPFWHLIFDEDLPPAEYRGWCDWDVVHNLLEIPWDFTVAKFTIGRMAGPLVLFHNSVPSPETPANWQRVLDSYEPVSWDDLGYLSKLPATILQRALTPDFDVFTTPAKYALHLGHLKQYPKSIVPYLTRFFPEAL